MGKTLVVAVNGLWLYQVGSCKLLNDSVGMVISNGGHLQRT